MLSALELQVIALFADAVLYGLYLTTLVHSLWCLLHPQKRIDWPMLIMTVAIFMSTTLDTALSVRRALLNLRHVLGGPPPNLLWSDTTMAFLVHLQTLLVDALLTYRCWIVFARSKLAIGIPAILWIADFVCTITRAYWQPQQATHIQLISHIIIVFWACSIALNIYATSLIVYRIVSIATSQSLSAQRVRFAMRVIIESGLLYTTTSVMLFVSIFTNNLFASTFISAINFQTVGIAFNLIIIRLASGTIDMARENMTQARFTTVQFETSEGVSLHRLGKNNENV